MRPLLLLLLVVRTAGAPAQADTARAATDAGRLLFSVRHFGVEQGLPHRSVNALAQDERGFIWAATPQGLARFDGYDFLNLTTTDGLSSDAVRTVVCDANGQLWILYMNGMLDIMDPRTLRVSTVQTRFGGNLPSVAVGPASSLSATNEGTIVFAQNGHLVRYNEMGFSAQRVDCPGPIDLTRIAWNGDVWCTCHLRTDGEWPVDLVRVSMGSTDGRVPAGEVMRSERVVGFVASGGLDRSGWKPRTDPGTYLIVQLEEHLRSAWIAPGGDVIEPQSPPRADMDSRETNGGFRSPLSDDLWLVNTSVRRMHAGEDPLLAPVVFDLAASFPEAGLLQRDVLRDRLGNVWVSGEFGLFRISMRMDHFQRFLHDPSGTDIVSHHIRGMLVSGGRLHVNTETSGYWVLDAATGAVIRSEPEGGLREVMISDGGGGLWRNLGTDMLHEDPAGHVDRRIAAPRGSYESWSAIVHKNGSLLTGGSKGLRMTPSGSDSSRAFPTGNRDLDGAWIWHLAIEPDGGIMACTSAGLFRFDAQGHVRDRWWSGASREDDAAHHLPADDIRYMYEDSTGVRWLATATRGLIRWEGAAGDVRVIGQREGLPAASIHAVYPDDRGSLWLPTDNGLVRYDPATGQVKVFTTADGITLNEFNRLAHARGPDGRFYFGGLNGITVFDPAALRAPSGRPLAPLVIKGVHAQREENDRLEDLTLTVLDGSTLLMRPKDRFFTVEFALLSYEDPALMRYAWRIDGIDTDWNIQREPHLRITTLPYGEHVLHIKAQDVEGRWSEERDIPITMIRPLHLRGWFILLCALALASIIYGVVRYRERQLQQVIRMRDRIASDLHDEVGSNLSSIVLFSTVVGRHADALPANAASMLQRIRENSKRAMESMNDIVWSVNSGHDSMSDLLDRMRAYAQPLCDAAEIELDIEADRDLLLRRLSMEQRKNLYLIFKEAVNNAVRHGRCTRIDVRLRQKEGDLELVIADNGIGFSENDLQPGVLGGNGLGNMGRRATEIGGTVEVSAPKEGGTQVAFTSSWKSD